MKEIGWENDRGAYFINKLIKEVKEAKDESVINEPLAKFMTDFKQLLEYLVYNTDEHNADVVSSDAQAIIDAIESTPSERYSITKNLSYCTLSNSASSIEKGNSYSSNIIPNDGYTVDEVSIIMGTTDITNTSYDEANNTISISAVTGNLTISIVCVEEEVYVPEVIYDNYTATGERFITKDIALNFNNGDYVDIVMDCTNVVTDNTNLIAVGKNSNDYLMYSTGECVTFYKRAQGGVDKLLIRVKDTATSASSIDKWLDISNWSNVAVKIDKNGVYVNDNAVSGITAESLAFLMNEQKYAIGGQGTAYSVATYDVTVYRHT